MDIAVIAEIMSLLLIIAVGIFGAKYALAKTKIGQFSTLVCDLWDALSDDELTQDEWDKLVKDSNALLGKDARMVVE